MSFRTLADQPFQLVGRHFEIQSLIEHRVLGAGSHCCLLLLHQAARLVKHQDSQVRV